MVVTRRQIVNEQDRYGGYGVQPDKSAREPRVEVEDSFNVEKQSEFSLNLNKPFVPDRVYSSTASPTVKRSDRQIPLFSARQEVIKPSMGRATETDNIQPNYSARPYPNTAEFVGTVTAQPKLKPQRREREDLMPSIHSAKQEKIEEIKSPKEKASAKTKAILAVYMLAVLILAAVVIGTGIAISSATASITQMQNEIANKNSIIISQNGELDKLGDELAIAGKAEDMGMEKNNNVNEIDLIPIIEPLKYESKTNWFDRFCDWLSSLIGG